MVIAVSLVSGNQKLHDFLKRGFRHEQHGKYVCPMKWSFLSLILN